MTKQARARRTPCGSCPYRKSVPSGVWHETEYDKLELYDGEIEDQLMNGAVNLFMCHQGGGTVCAGWLGHRDPLDLLAVRIGLSDGELHRSIVDYQCGARLFATGAEAAAHGKAKIENPDERAQQAIEKIVKKRHLD